MQNINTNTPKTSLRRRISLAFAILSCGALLALAISILLSTEEREEELIDEIVNTSLHQIEARWPIAGQLLLPKNLYFYHAPIGQTPPGLPLEVSRFAVGNAEFYDQGAEYHVGVREHAGQRLYVLYDTRDHEARLTNIYIGVGVAVLLLSGLGLILGYYFSGSILRQLSSLTTAVEQDLPVDVSAMRDQEVSILAHAIATSREQTATLLQRERDFTAHVGHELRTPLTRIRTTAELIRELGDLPETTINRLAQIEMAADEMQARLTALLFLARDLRAMQLGPVSLHSAIEQALQHCATHKPHLTRHNRVPVELIIEADPQLLQMLLDNLLGNALRYTESGEVVISWEQGALWISDTGAGIASEQQHRVLAPFERASDLPDGFGLGLAIVNRICAAQGWQCHIHSQAGQGTQIAIQIQTLV
jgi:signal transduction histidine kinase